MLLKDKIILVFYLGSEFLNDRDLMVEIREELNSLEDESSVIVIAPDPDHTGIRVEAINPKLVSEEDYERVKVAVEKLEEASEKFKSQIPNPYET